MARRSRTAPRKSLLTDNAGPTGDRALQTGPSADDLAPEFPRQTNLAVHADMHSPEGGAQKGGELADSEVLKQIREFRQEAFDARKTRMKKNEINQLAYMDEQDFSHKQEGQSAEFLPKVSVSAEQFSAFVKRSLVQFGDWFEVKLNDNLPDFITDKQMKDILKLYIHNLPAGVNKIVKFETVVADAAKGALLDSLMIFKVHGRPIKQRTYEVDTPPPGLNMQTGQTVQAEPALRVNEKTTWRLCIDIVRPEDYFPDPTGRGLYEIHEVERDFHEVLAMADAGIYDSAVVEAIDGDFRDQEEKKRKENTRGQDRAEPPRNRRTVVIREFWGTLLDEDGYPVHENCVAAVANDKYVIRKPEPNPWWHGESPFVTCPLIRVPHSVWHKALYDSASHLNIALNEMFNLMLDGGMAAVWGIKQLRTDFLEDPTQISDGIPQGITLAVKGDLPANAKVIENCTEGEVPTDAMAIFEMVAREFTQAALTNDIKLGSLPPRQVKATEITSADQSQAVTLDSISADIENDGMEPVLKKAWLTILQHVEDFDRKEIIQTIGVAPAQFLLSLSKAERFAMFANIATFEVNGLSAMLSRVRDFQKTMALMQVVASNPIMMQAFMTDYSPKRVLKTAMKQLNINPDDWARTPNQMSELPQEMQQIMLFAQMMGGMQGGAAQDGTGGTGLATGGPGGMVSPAGGPPEQTAQINQEANPLTGMGP
jgi:hypothetical protein